MTARNILVFYISPSVAPTHIVLQPVSDLSLQSGVIRLQTGVIRLQAGVIRLQTGVIRLQTGVIRLQAGVIRLQSDIHGKKYTLFVFGI